MIATMLEYINPINVAYAVMIIGVLFCFLMSHRQKRQLRDAATKFAFAFVRLSNFISPEPQRRGVATEHGPHGGMRALPPERQSGTMRAIMNRALDQTSVDLFADMVDAADDVSRLVGRSNRDREQFSDPIQELLLIAHTFLEGCENPKTINTLEKKRQFDGFLQDQLDYRMVLLKRISGSASLEFQELNEVYEDDMAQLEEQEKAEKKKQRRRGSSKKSPEKSVAG